ncbi:MAG TPA: MGMT family protein [Anaerolineaceae bacterium]|nr:MGMT family protein [Anaerolineaceae bacterium]
MEPSENMIVDIPNSRARFFGCSGKMLLPSASTVTALIQKIPQGSLITTYQLRVVLANQFNVQAACPVTIMKALKEIAQTPNTNIPYWRVIKKNGELIAAFPGGVEHHAEHLRMEGFSIGGIGKKQTVINFIESLLHSE